MEILLIAATAREIEPSLNHFAVEDGHTAINSGKHRIQCLITGLGMVATAFELGKHLATKSYDLVINLGIAGSFDRNLAIGQVLHITDDSFADLGAEDGDQFLSIDDLGFGQSVCKPLDLGFKLPILNELNQVSSITVNRVHGSDTSIAKTLTRISPQLESMEGAAVFYACNQVQIPALQIRSVSNYVERRNRDNWNIDLAIKNLNVYFLRLLNDLP
jgi:futalosine hydrolase